MNSPKSRLLKISVVLSDLRILAILRRSVALFLCMGVILCGHETLADKIILKDGSVEESDHVWESDHYVHFILKGTQSVEVRYAKEIVERIERDESPKPVSTRQVEPQSLPQSSTPIEKSPKAKVNLAKLPPASSAEKNSILLPDEKYIRQNRKVSFYDPHRAKRYWAGRNSHFASLGAALDALARQYGRSRKWVEDHMGSENDLGEIHANLVKQLKLEMRGVTEDLKEEKLSIAKPAEVKKPAAQMEVSPKAAIQIQIPDIPKGIKFYDPRRKHKYWTSPTEHYDTLTDAVRALAKQYGERPEWIEEHLGGSNDLSEIHINIRKSLKLSRDAMPKNEPDHK